MGKNFPQKITDNTQAEFTVDEFGLYAISITASCEKDHDLKVDIDEKKFRKIPGEKSVQPHNIPPAWNEHTRDKIRDPLNYVDKSEWEECYFIAAEILEGKEKDPVSGATHFYSTAADSGFPWWANDKTFRVKIGITYFYELES